MSQKRRAVDDYTSDDGFVEDAPKVKKSRTTVKSSAIALEKETDDEGNTFWEISRTRRVQVSEFKGKPMVSIREYYEKDGKMLPGKKGISLTLDQFGAVIDVLPQLETELKKRGHAVQRPAYGSDRIPATSDDDLEDHSHSSQVHQDRSGNKGNHEATSDEDDD